MKNQIALGMITVNMLERRVTFNVLVEGRVIQVDLNAEEVGAMQTVLQRAISLSKEAKVKV